MKSLICVKLGGAAAEKKELLKLLQNDMKELQQTYRFIVVHGGGAEISKFSKKMGITPFFENGIRLTTAEEMDIVDMVLAGKVNKMLVRSFQAAGMKAVGLSGADAGIIEAASIDGRSRTGRVVAVRTAFLDACLEQGYLPVLNTCSSDSGWTAMNVNADDGAMAVAGAMKCAGMVFLSDIPGVMAEGEVLALLDGKTIDRLTADGTIKGGMVPKVKNALESLKSGIKKVVIGCYEKQGDLAALIAGTLGTTIAAGSGGAE